MVDVSSHFVVASVDESDKSYDMTILASVGALAAGLVIAIWAHALSAGNDPSALDLMTAFL
jgi:hypothetical protein